jgi:uncharacterized iron-regulated membrane protein
MPTGVAVAVVIGWLSVAVDVFGAGTTWLLAGDGEFMSAIGVDAYTARAAAFGTEVAAAITAPVVHQLGRGSNVARALVGIVMVVRMLLGVWRIVALGAHQRAESPLIISVAVVALEEEGQQVLRSQLTQSSGRPRARDPPTSREIGGSRQP